MEFIGVEISGYRRFRETTRMDLAPRVVSIVGPNAAGKSSFLRAVLHLDHDDPYRPAEITRGERFAFVEARFALEDADRAVLTEIPEAAGVRQLLVRKDSDEPREYILEPEPERNLKKRKAVAARVGKLSEHAWVQLATETQAREYPDAPLTARQLVTQVLTPLNGAKNFDSNHLDALANLSQFLRTVMTGEYFEDGPGLAKRFHRIPDDLDAVVAEEAEEHPRDRAIDKLRSRVPRFIKFGRGVRDLNAPYEVLDDGDPAVANLLALAGTSWAKLQRVVQSDDPADRVVWRDAANQEVRRRFTEAWQQGYSKLEVRFELTGTTLDILLAMQAKDFIRVGEQSDGVQQFLALRAFMALHNEAIKPIVLIDEAETHLHYDAQADLMRVLEEQVDASMVICTTHSAGCLPRDLGTGVRAIVPIIEEVEVDGKTTAVQTDHSAVINGFWTEGHGFSPMLIAMGASAFAFSSTRRALVTEGMSEVILLPTLIRESTGKDRLGYQVTPSFAGADPEAIPNFDLLASRVAYLADGDKGGCDHAKKLTKHGVLMEQILFLGGSNTSGLSLEDIVTKKAYLQAVNRELEVWQDDAKFPEEALPDTGRSAAVRKWCKRRTGRDGDPIELSNVAIAQRVLDQRQSEKQLVRTDKRDVLRQLDQKAEALLDIPTGDLRAGAQ